MTEQGPIPERFEQDAKAQLDQQAQRFLDHVKELERLEVEYGFDIDVAKEVNHGLLDINGSGPSLLRFWTNLYDGLSEQPQYTAFKRYSTQNGTICTGFGAPAKEIFRFGKLDIFENLKPEHIIFTPSTDESFAHITIEKTHDRVVAFDPLNGSRQKEVVLGSEEPLLLGTSEARELKDQIIDPRETEHAKPDVIFAVEAADLEDSLSAQQGLDDNSWLFTSAVREWWETTLPQEVRDRMNGASGQNG
ncbi:MAG: hypothetical protein ABJA64_00950 [Candidatus Saccharibacteria bacterium]